MFDLSQKTLPFGVKNLCTTKAKYILNYQIKKC